MGRLEEVEARKIADNPDYAVTRDGRVFSKSRGDWCQLNPSPDADGYMHVSVGGKRYAIHTLVLEAFVGPCPEGLDCCRHLDGDSYNNHVENLCWGTDSENAKDAARHRKMRAAGELAPSRRTSIIFSIRVSAASADAYARVAAAAGMTKHEWALSILNAASGRTVLPDEMKRPIEVELEEWPEDEGPKKVRDGKW